MRLTATLTEKRGSRKHLGPALLAVVFLGAAMAPNVLGHGDSGAHNGLANLTPGPYGWRGAQGPGTMPPAGWYYGSASDWAQLISFSPTVHVNSFPCPLGNPTVDALLCEAIPIDPSLTLPFAQVLCDLEVGGSGDSPAIGQDESIIDGTLLPPTPIGTGGRPYLPDGTFNDGGIGAVCHTPSGFYAWEPFNTAHCTSGGPLDVAHAKDVMHGGNVWIMTGCDSTRPVSTSPLLLQTLSLEVCSVSALGSQYSSRYFDCINRFRDCLPWSQLGLTYPEQCQPLPSATACVPDGIPDAVNAGFGGANDGPISSVHAQLTNTDGPWLRGVPYPSVVAGCYGSNAAQVVYVWTSVIATVSSTGEVALNSLSTPAYGWVQ